VFDGKMRMHEEHRIPDNHNPVAMLVRQNGETLTALLKRLDKAIGKFYDGDEIVDEVNAE
jgi:hypothetical protein